LPGFSPAIKGPREEVEALREELRRMHIQLVRDLVPVEEKVILSQFRRGGH